MGETFPYVAWAVISAVVLFLVVRDRYNRRLKLVTSGEEAAINELRRRGAVSESEAIRLSGACNSLPAVDEVAPVPDIGLRIAAALNGANSGCGGASAARANLRFGTPTALLWKSRWTPKTTASGSAAWRGTPPRSHLFSAGGVAIPAGGRACRYRFMTGTFTQPDADSVNSRQLKQ